MILGFSLDSIRENRAFAKKFNFPFLLLSDPEDRIAMEYHAVVDPDQSHADRITYVIGPDGVILQAYEKVDVKVHAEEILAKL